MAVSPFLDTLRAVCWRAQAAYASSRHGNDPVVVDPRWRGTVERCLFGVSTHRCVAFAGLESQRHQAVVIGEDLALFPEGFHEILKPPACTACVLCLNALGGLRCTRCMGSLQPRDDVHSTICRRSPAGGTAPTFPPVRTAIVLGLAFRRPTLPTNARVIGVSSVACPRRCWKSKNAAVARSDAARRRCRSGFGGCTTEAPLFLLPVGRRVGVGRVFRGESFQAPSTNIPTGVGALCRRQPLIAGSTARRPAWRHWRAKRPWLH